MLPHAESERGERGERRERREEREERELRRDSMREGRIDIV